MGIKKEATASKMIEILEQQSKANEGSKDFAEKVYRLLNSFDSESLGLLLVKLKKDKLIFIPRDGGNFWASPSEVVWQDQTDIVGEDFTYLEKIYPSLKEFFIEKIGIKPNVDKEFFARKWLSLQKEKNLDADVTKKILTKIYYEMRLLCQQDESQHPKWWNHFVQNANVWTQDNTFENPEKVFVPDDGDLKQIFKGKVFFAWRPEKDSFADWETLYKSLKVRSLSESVETDLPDDVDAAANSEPEYITIPTKILVLTYIYEKYPSDFERIKKSRMLKAILETKEGICSRYLNVTYYLDDIEQLNPQGCFWDHSSDPMLYISNESKQKAMIKNYIARTIARDLMPNRAYKELADWIELVLGSDEEDLIFRIKQKNWNIPAEIKEWMNSKTEMVRNAHPSQFNSQGSDKSVDKIEFSPKISVEDKHNTLENQHQPEILNSQSTKSDEPKKIQQSEISSNLEEDEKISDSSNFDYLPELQKAINRPGATTFSTIEEEYEDDYVVDANRRRFREQEELEQKRQNEPIPSERRKLTEREILERPDSQVRTTLEQWYGGKCQICNSTFPDRYGKPFFMAKYIVERKHAQQIDTPGNAICLCAEHFAKWQHGSLEAENFYEQVKAQKLRSEGGDSICQIQIKLCGEDCILKYKEKHMVALQGLISLAERDKN